MRRLLVVLLVCILGIAPVLPAAAEAAAPRLVLSETEIRVAVGKSIALKAAVEDYTGKKGKASWESSDPAVCTVSNAGAVKAVSEGTAVVTCRMELPDGGTLTAECKVATFVAAKSLKAVNKDIRLNVGETAQAEYTLLPEETTEKNLDWSSDNEAVATVDAEGKITAAGPGTAKITAQTKDGSNRKTVFAVYVPSLAAEETEFTISGMSGITVPVSYYGADFDKSVSVKVTGKPVRVTAKCEGNRIELHLDALEAGDSRVEISDKADKKAKLALTVHTEAGALSNNLLLEITGNGFRMKSKGLFFSINVCNHSAKKVAEVGYYIDLYAESGEQRFYPKQYEGNDFPVVSGYWRYTWRINPGAKAHDAFYPLVPGYITDRDIAEIRCAISWIKYDDGTSINIPDSQKYWYSSVSGYMKKPDVKANYTGYPQEILDKAGPVKLGYRDVQVGENNKSWYGVPCAGCCVTHVDSGSIAEKCGLQLKDLVFEVDGIRFEDDPLFLWPARAKIADGETVIFKVYRDGKIVELEFHQ